jgi:hypothetical protein
MLLRPHNINNGDLDMSPFFKTTLVSLSAMAIATSPAFAGGKNERATAAIAAAQAKIDAANKVGASGQVPELQASATAALNVAREDLSRGEKDKAIADANQAGELADRAIGEADKAKTMQAQAQTNAATDAAISAQGAAADANARASAAEQSAAMARTPVIIQAAATPAPAQTTVTTETTTSPAMSTPAAKTTVKRRTVHHTTHRHPVARKVTTVHVRTKTTVTR